MSLHGRGQNPSSDGCVEGSSFLELPVCTVVGGTRQGNCSQAEIVHRVCIQSWGPEPSLHLAALGAPAGALPTLQQHHTDAKTAFAFSLGGPLRCWCGNSGESRSGTLSSDKAVVLTALQVTDPLAACTCGERSHPYRKIPAEAVPGNSYTLPRWESGSVCTKCAPFYP